MIDHFNKTILPFVLFVFLLVPNVTHATTFDSWLLQTKAEARAQGISEATINAALNGIYPIQRVIELDGKQPEKKKTFAQYKKMIVNPIRIKRGREMMQRYHRELDAVEAQYGVPKQFIVALWGIETNYGANTGGFNVISALATLAWEGRRAAFFKKELINALKIIDAGHISADKMKGSWAGAMGQNQFMPSSFNAYAVDQNGDGRRDIWGTALDVFGSSANYLKKNGWIPGERWGRRVLLPSNFPANLVSTKIRKPLSAWTAMGIRKFDGSPLPNENMMASIVAPDGLAGEAYIVYNNYQVIMDWNRSTYFATSVGLLADKIASY